MSIHTDHPDRCTEEDCHSASEPHLYGEIHCSYSKHYDEQDGDYYIRPQGLERYVNVFEVEQVYGGPEEGGWWYSVGTPIEAIHCATPEEAEAVMDYLRDKYKEIRDNEVRYSYGTEYSVRWDTDFPKPFPESRPHYE